MKDSMSIDEVIKHCQEISHSGYSKGCSLEYTQLANWLIELKSYRDRYGYLEKSHPTIILTKSNLNKEKIRIDEITRIDEVDGIYNGNHYHSRVWINSGGSEFHYYIESPEEINDLIKEEL